MKKFLEKTSNKLFGLYMILVGVWLFTAISTQAFFIYLELSGQEERSLDLANQVSWKIDGTFKDNPGNIWYEGPVAKK